VFVSSTLGELAADRRAIRTAVASLRMTPIMFELGARPHPPRDLYRAYLEQSDVSVGVYWQHYGWAAPGEAISGLEDEYRLAAERPRLLYIKEPAPIREDRLDTMLRAFGTDARASYKRLGTPDELLQRSGHGSTSHPWPSLAASIAKVARAAGPDAHRTRGTRTASRNSSPCPDGGTSAARK
jgi:hypothetical protein